MAWFICFICMKFGMYVTFIFDCDILSMFRGSAVVFEEYRRGYSDLDSSLKCRR